MADTTAACLEYGGVRILKAFGILTVGMVMQTRVIERYEATFESIPCCMFVRKANQRLILHIPVLL